MGLNLDKRTHAKVGDIIYPAYNGTDKWWQRSRWDLVTEVDQNKRIIRRYHIYDHATVKAIELIRLLLSIKEFNERLDKIIEQNKQWGGLHA